MMKISNQPLLAFLLLFIVFSFTRCEDKDGDDVASTVNVHVIELEVNTRDISRPDWKQYCTIKGNTSGSLEDYTTVVKKGDIVIWVGVSSTSIEDEVLITMVRREHGSKLLKKPVYQGNDGVVAGKIDPLPDVGHHEEEKYSLHFRIESKDNPINGTFPIDPKLRVY